ncbi:zinc ribbon domain-containing protein [Chromobacterium haemolyticum]|uniref:zinc ribbon domain-containing protein n=1 Tax=Chromobacterium TaxID=535 RepID=UPI00193BE3D7
MFCSNCGVEVLETANYCHACGADARNGKHSGSAINIGEGSINVGVGNLPNANIHIGDKIQHGNEPIIYELNRTGDIKTPVKAAWVFIAGAVGFAASILDILSNLGFKAHELLSIKFPPMAIPFIGVIFVTGAALVRHKFIWLQFFGLETDRNGFIHIVKLRGTCPHCKSKLSVRYVGPKNAKEIVAICSRNPDKHRYTFDPTELPEL